MPQPTLHETLDALANTARLEADERDEAARIIGGGGVALYCRGAGSPVVACASFEAFKQAQRGRRLG